MLHRQDSEGQSATLPPVRLCEHSENFIEDLKPKSDFFGDLKRNGAQAIPGESVDSSLPNLALNFEVRESQKRFQTSVNLSNKFERRIEETSASADARSY